MSEMFFNWQIWEEKIKTKVKTCSNIIEGL